MPRVLLVVDHEFGLSIEFCFKISICSGLFGLKLPYEWTVCRAVVHIQLIFVVKCQFAAVPCLEIYVLVIRP